MINTLLCLIHGPPVASRKWEAWQHVAWFEAELNPALSYWYCMWYIIWFTPCIYKSKSDIKWRQYLEYTRGKYVSVTFMRTTTACRAKNTEEDTVRTHIIYISRAYSRDDAQTSGVRRTSFIMRTNCSAWEFFKGKHPQIFYKFVKSCGLETGRPLIINPKGSRCAH